MSLNIFNIKEVYFKVPFYGQGMNCVSFFLLELLKNYLLLSLINNLFIKKRDLKIASYFLSF
jgi:hypothetical protein